MSVRQAPIVSCLRSAGEQDAWLFAPSWSSAARPAASSFSAGLDVWIHAQSRSMTLSEHRKLEEVRAVHVWPKAMCVCIRRGAISAHRVRIG
jgi:hypothetical protein